MKVFELGSDGGHLMRAILARRAAEPARTGLHVSTICDDIIKTMDPSRYKNPINDTSMFLFQETGNVIEDILAEQMAVRLGWVKPEPRQDRDGVWGSPDGYSPRSRTIDEIKCTWVSERTFIDVSPEGKILDESWKFYRYRIQATKYADVDMFDADRIRLHVIFLNGNYRPPFPNARTFTVRLTHDDKQENRELLRQHAVDRGWLKEKR